MRHVLLMVMRNQDSMSQELFGAFYDEVMSEVSIYRIQLISSEMLLSVLKISLLEMELFL